MIARFLCFFQGHNWVWYRSEKEGEWIGDCYVVPMRRVCTKCWKHDR